MARTIQDYQRDSKEEKEIYVSMKNNKENRYRVGYNIVGYRECFVMAKNKKEAEQKFNNDDVKEVGDLDLPFSEPKIKRIELVKELEIHNES